MPVSPIAPSEGAPLDRRDGVAGDPAAAGSRSRRGQAVQRRPDTGVFPAGQQSVVTATIENRSAQQDLGSANLTAPSAFTVRAASLPGTSGGSATVSGGVIELRNLSLAPGAAIQVAVTVDAGCAAGAYAWSVLAKQANRFNGSPGNDFLLVSPPEALATTVTGGCVLRFAAQPQDARVGERISAADFDPTGPPVSVEVVDDAGNRLTSSTPHDLSRARHRGRPRDAARPEVVDRGGGSRGVRRPQRRRARRLPPTGFRAGAGACRFCALHDPAGRDRVRGGRRLLRLAQHAPIERRRQRLRRPRDGRRLPPALVQHWLPAGLRRL